MELIWILGDQLLQDHPLLREPADDRWVALIESAPRARRLRYHQQKLTLLYAAMRHHAMALERAGHRVLYHRLEAPLGDAVPEATTAGPTDELPDSGAVLASWIQRHGVQAIHLLEPNDIHTQAALPALAQRLAVPIHTHPSPQFLLPRSDFLAWAEGRRSLVMEQHYRRLRKQLGVLMDPDGHPVGGVWNTDADNRQTRAQFRKARPRVPALPPPERDPVVREVAAQVGRVFAAHPGRAEELWLPATRAGALAWLERFVEERLAGFGPWEDLLVDQEPILFHSVLSPLLNIGLLTPMECVKAAEAAHAEGRAPLSSVEGFIRQIVGWREFIHGMYWRHMPAYGEMNALEAHRPLPRWAYTGETELRCVHRAIEGAIRLGYNHHIQRLMVLGNYFLLGGYAPQEVLRWYLEMYLDAYDWVMVPNVLGMVLYADGGWLATKPYAAGPAYLDRMGDHCAHCRYNPKQKTGPDACPFQALYWAFQSRHADRFRGHPRQGMMVRQLDRLGDDTRRGYEQAAERFLEAQG
ncbi:MAG: cryptochrome/photolyase family protein [Cyanobacteriota bacterium]|nr:cryptochrome/photolyase family protein [Cyanobacteriota bacterium]